MVAPRLWSESDARSQVVDLVKHARAGFKIAQAGTSIEDAATRNILPPNPSPSRAKFTDGYITHAMALSGQRAHFSVDGDFGVSGYTLQNMLDNVGLVIAYYPTHCVLGGGSNDFPTAITLGDMKIIWVALVTALIQSNICVIVMPAPPRGTGVLTVAQVHKQMAFTNFQREWCHNNRGALFCDYLPYVTDQTSDVSVPLPGMTKVGDPLHLSAIGSYWKGKALAELIMAICPPTRTDFSSAADYYSADNPTGSLHYSGTTNYSRMANSGGSQTADGNLTHAGTLAAGLTAVRSGSSVCTWTHSKENPRTDPGRNSGERQIEEIAITGIGDVDEVYNIRRTLNVADIAPGEWFYAEANIEFLTAPNNMWALECYVLDDADLNQTAIDMGLNTTSAGVMASVVEKWVLRTDAIPRQASTTALQSNIRARMKADTGNAGAKFVIGDFKTVKLAA